MKKRITLIKSLLVAATLLVGGASSVWAGDKTVVKYSFDDATSPSLTVGNRSVADYSYTSVISSTAFLNLYDANNNTNGITAISLGSADLTGEKWTLEFYWAGLVGGNNRAGNTTLKAGETTLFNIADAASYGGSMALTYGTDGSASIVCPNVTKAVRFTANTATLYNKTDYWLLFTITGDPTNGVKMTIRNADSGNILVEDVVLNATNITPTVLNLQPGCIGAIGIDELSLTYYVEGEVIQTPVANYTAVNGINRTVTATCETEGATIQHSTDGVNYEDGASITVFESGNVYFKAVKGTSESDVLTFAAEAGEAITLIAPSIVRSDNTTVTITADQTSLLLSPTATIYYTYGDENGSFTGSKTLTVAAEATITAYATATGYTTSSTSERAVALFPTNIKTIENTPTKTKGTETFALGTDITTVSEREYVALLLDDVQWGTNVYLQNLTLSDPIVWGVRNNNWYINTTDKQWVLIRNMQAGDIIIANLTFAASDMVNATYSEKLTYSNRYAYVVDTDGDVELAFNKPNESTMDYIYGFYAYRTVTSVSAAITDASGFATYVAPYALNFKGVEGLTAYTATCDGSKVTLTPVDDVQAGTAVVLKGEAKSYDVPVIASSETPKGDLKASATAIAYNAEATSDYYYLALNGESKAQFTKLTSGSIAAGKAYLEIAKGEGARNLAIVIAGETTGIKAIETAKAADGIFNINGQRIAAPQKGLYIVNGKKVVIK